MDLDKLSELFSQGYEIDRIGNFYNSKHDSHTRFVIVEKYPEKESDVMVFNVDIFLRPKPVLEIKLDVNLKKPDEQS